MPPFHSPLPLPFTLHLKTRTQGNLRVLFLTHIHMILIPMKTVTHKKRFSFKITEGLIAYMIIYSSLYLEALLNCMKGKESFFVVRK